MINYSYDWNINKNIDNLNIVNTGTTHEVGIGIYLTGNIEEVLEEKKEPMNVQRL